MMRPQLPRSRPRTVEMLAGAFCAMALLSGCGADPQGTIHPTAPPETESPNEVSRDDLKNEVPVKWVKHEVISDSEVRVSFWIGTPRCFDARAAVSETASAVEIAVFEGTIPNAPDACTLEAREASIVVQTQAPIGDRAITQP